MAYGPIEAYGEELANSEFVENLKLPSHQGRKTFSIILTDSAGDGVCCNFGLGGPMELYDGPTESGQLLFTTSFQGVDRVVHSFVIGNNVGSSSESSTNVLFLPVISTLILIIGGTVWS